MNAPLPDHDAAHARARAGLLFGLAAYGLWGVMPIYFKLLFREGSFDADTMRASFDLALEGIAAR